MAICPTCGASSFEGIPPPPDKRVIAYPRLVEALRDLAPIIERFAAEADPQNSVLDQRRDELRALLRDLGELA